MPTYVYGCDVCGHRFETFQKVQDAPLTECPECGARIRRVFQPAPIVFKGSGWYSTDSRASKPATTEETSEAGSTAADGTKRGDESAPAPKADDGVGAAPKKSVKSETASPAKAVE